MEKLIQFRERQEVTPDDMNGTGLFAQQSLDHIVEHAITDDVGYAKFAVTQESSTSVRVAAGLLFKAGKVYEAPQDVVFSLTTHLPVLNKKIVAIYAFGSIIETNVEERDFEINADTEETEPQAVPMVKMRKAELQKIAGLESVDPQLPAIPDNGCLIATVLLSTTGVSLITQYPDTKLPSVKSTAADVSDLKVWRTQTDPKVGALTSDLAALQKLTAGKAGIDSLFSLMGDVARLKNLARLPASYSEYGSDYFYGTTGIDLVATGLDVGGTPTAKVDLGLKFPDAGRATANLGLFNPNDPNAHRSGTDLVVPAYTSEAVLEVVGDNGEIGISQYQVQATVTVSYVEDTWVTKVGWEEGTGYGGSPDVQAPEPLLTQGVDMSSPDPTTWKSYQVQGPLTVSQYAQALIRGISYLPYGIQ